MTYYTPEMPSLMGIYTNSKSEESIITLTIVYRKLLNHISGLPLPEQRLMFTTSWYLTHNNYANEGKLFRKLNLIYKQTNVLSTVYIPWYISSFIKCYKDPSSGDNKLYHDHRYKSGTLDAQDEGQHEIKLINALCWDMLSLIGKMFGAIILITPKNQCQPRLCTIDIMGKLYILTTTQITCNSKCDHISSTVEYSFSQDLAMIYTDMCYCYALQEFLRRYSYILPVKFSLPMSKDENYMVSKQLELMIYTTNGCDEMIVSVQQTCLRVKGLEEYHGIASINHERGDVLLFTKYSMKQTIISNYYYVTLLNTYNYKLMHTFIKPQEATLYLSDSDPVIQALCKEKEQNSFASLFESSLVDISQIKCVICTTVEEYQQSLEFIAYILLSNSCYKWAVDTEFRTGASGTLLTSVQLVTPWISVYYVLDGCAGFGELVNYISKHSTVTFLTFSPSMDIPMFAIAGVKEKYNIVDLKETNAYNTSYDLQRGYGLAAYCIYNLLQTKNKTNHKFSHPFQEGCLKLSELRYAMNDALLTYQLYDRLFNNRLINLRIVQLLHANLTFK